MTPRAFTSLLVVVCGVGFSACRQPPTVVVGTVESLRVRIAPERDGNVLVAETYRVRPSAAGQILLERDIALVEADGLEIVAVEVDGQRVAPGTAGVTVVDAGLTRKVIRWTLSDVGAVARDLAVAVRAISGMAVTEPRVVLHWAALESPRTFDVGETSIRLDLESGAGVYPGTGMAEAGWNVDWTADAVTARRSGVARGETATFRGVFDFDRSGVRDPAWERNRDRQRQFWPALLAGALFFIVIGVGTLVILRIQYPRARGGLEPALLDERLRVARGLRHAGLAGLCLAAVCGLMGFAVLGFLGPWVQLIPGSIGLVSVLFIGAAPRFARETHL